MANSCVRKSSDNIVRSPAPDMEIPNKSVPEYIWGNAEKYADNPDMTCGLSGRSYSFKEARDLSQRFGAALMKKGFRPGDVLAVVLPNMPEASIIQLGALEFGLRVTATNSSFRKNELLHLFQATGAKIVVTLPSTVSLVKEVIKQLKSEMAIITVSYDEAKITDGDLYDFHELINGSIELAVSSTRTLPEDIAILLPTSGTTGTSKIVTYTHKNIVSFFVQNIGMPMNNSHGNTTSQMNYAATSEHQNVILVALPAGLGYAALTVLKGLAMGAHIITLPTWEPRLCLSIISNQKPRTVFLHCNPPMLFDMQLLAETKDLQSVKVVYHSAGTLIPSHMENLLKKMPNPKEIVFCSGYGLTETMLVTFLKIDPTSYNPEAIGFIFSNTKVKIVDASGKSLGVGEEGEICVKGPQVTKGYYNNDNANAEAFDSDGWFKTGDLAYYDEKGALYLKGRLKDIIKVEGILVSPAELEVVLLSHPCVADAAVVGVPADERTGEKPVAFVVAKPGAHLECNEVIEFAAEQVAPHKRLSQIVVKDQLPRNPSGKVLKRLLKEEYLKSI